MDQRELIYRLQDAAAQAPGAEYANGRRELARLLTKKSERPVTANAIGVWCVRGRVPHAKRLEIIEVGADLGIDIDPSDFRPNPKYGTTTTVCKGENV